MPNEAWVYVYIDVLYKYRYLAGASLFFGGTPQFYILTEAIKASDL